VVFVCDRQGPALARRERCLKLAAISYRIEAERRPSGTYYKLSVGEHDAVTAHLALQMGGCTRTSKLRQDRATLRSTIREMGRTFWEEVLLLAGRVSDFFWRVTPRLLTGPR
jgi:hypothetical protein